MFDSFHCRLLYNKATLASLGSANFKDVTLIYANLDSPVTIAASPVK